MFGSIKWRIFLGCVLLAAIILGVLWLVQICFLDTFYQSIKTKQIASAAQEIARHIDDEDLDSRLEELAREKQVCIVITDESGYILVA